MTWKRCGFSISYCTIVDGRNPTRDILPCSTRAEPKLAFFTAVRTSQGSKDDFNQRFFQYTPGTYPRTPNQPLVGYVGLLFDSNLLFFSFIFEGHVPPPPNLTARYTRHVSKRNISKPSFWSSSNSMTKYLVPLGISFKLCIWDIYWGHAVQPCSTVGKSSRIY